MKLVHFPIVTPLDLGMRGVKDSLLIPWLGEHRLAWITKDDEARRDHLDDMIKYSVSAVWVRGIDRKKNKISIQHVHLLLTVRLPRIIAVIEAAHGPRHFMLYIAGERAMMEEIHDLQRMRLRRGKRSKQGA